MDGSKPCCFSDASVSGDKKAVEIWFGEEEGEQTMLTCEVKGLPHDSGRGEMTGPVIALRTLVRLQETGSTIRRVEMGVDNMEVVHLCETKEVRKIPSMACVRNVDLKL